MILIECMTIYFSLPRRQEDFTEQWWHYSARHLHRKKVQLKWNSDGFGFPVLYDGFKLLLYGFLISMHTYVSTFFLFFHHSNPTRFAQNSNGKSVNFRKQENRKIESAEVLFPNWISTSWFRICDNNNIARKTTFNLKKANHAGMSV